MHWPLFAALLAFAPTSAWAALDQTVDECAKTYGRPQNAAVTSEIRPPTRNMYYYVWRGISVKAYFVGRDVADSRCAALQYDMVTGNPPGVYPLMSPADIAALLALNAGGSSWEQVPGGWIRKDRQAYASEFRYTANGSPTNQLHIFKASFDPKRAAEIAAVPAPK